jgi:hypothetical protein
MTLSRVELNTRLTRSAVRYRALIEARPAAVDVATERALVAAAHAALLECRWALDELLLLPDGPADEVLFAA